MNYLSDLCFLCLVYDKNIKLKENDFLKMQEEFQYFIPEPIFHNSEIPKYVCNDCIKSLNETNAFRRKCLRNIAIYNDYEQKLTQYSGSHKYLTIVLTDILHPNNAELNCDIEIKTEIFEAEDSKIQNDTKNYKTCKVTENEKLICDELNYNREVKNEISQTHDLKQQTKYQSGEINTDIHNVDDKIENNYIKHEINEEFIIKEEDEQEDFYDIHSVTQQEQVCSQNNLFNQNVPGNSTANKNDSTATVSKSTQNQELLQNTDIIKCKKCPKTYSNNEDLKMHHRFHTKKSHICDVCPKSFKTLTLLKKHKYVHSGKKPYVCDVCQKAFTRKVYLKYHKRIHSDEKPYLCDVCEKTFRYAGDLTKHKRIHSSKESYVCDVCQKTFSQKGSLKSHKRVHTGEKPYVCDICQRAFNRTDILSRHKVTHSNEKLHACDICQKFFGRKDYLRKHKRITCGVVMT